MPTPTKLNLKKALKAKIQGQSYRDIAKAQGLDVQTVWHSVAPLLKAMANQDTVNVYREKQAEILDGLAAQTLAAISNEDIAKASLRDKAVSVGILIDKSRLIQGQSTANHLVIHAQAAQSAADQWGDGRVIEAEEVAGTDETV